MKIICAEVPDVKGERYIYDIVPDYRWYWYIMPTGNARRVVIDVEETEDNKELCQDMATTIGAVNIEGVPKYYIDAADNVIPRADWEPHIDVDTIFSMPKSQHGT